MIALYNNIDEHQSDRQRPLEQPQSLLGTTVHGGPHQLRQVRIHSLRDQDGKIYARSRMFGYSRILGIAVVVAIPMVYLMNVPLVGFSQSLWVPGGVSTALVA